jgi:hypothetical protein
MPFLGYQTELIKVFSAIMLTVPNLRQKIALFICRRGTQAVNGGRL